MTETTGYLGNHPKSHLQRWGNQCWLKTRVTDRPLSDTGKFKKPFYLLLARFSGHFECILLVWSGHRGFLSVVRQEWFFAQRLVLPRRKQAPSGMSLVPSISREYMGAAKNNHVSCQQNPKLFK